MHPSHGFSEMAAKRWRDHAEICRAYGASLAAFGKRNDQVRSQKYEVTKETTSDRFFTEIAVSVNQLVPIELAWELTLCVKEVKIRPHMTLSLHSSKVIRGH